MEGLNACPELKTLRDSLFVGKPLPADFLEHAKICGDCLLWTSWTLAVNEVFTTTNRIYDNENCPDKHDLVRLVLGTIWGLRKPGINKMNRNIYYINHEEMAELSQAALHIDRQKDPDACKYCRDYYDTLYDKSCELQTQYEARIKAGTEKGIIQEDHSEQFRAEKIGYGPNGPTKKPN